MIFAGFLPTFWGVDQLVFWARWTTLLDMNMFVVV